MTPRRIEQPHHLPTSAPLVPFIDGAFHRLSRRPLEEQRHALNTAMAAFSLGERIRLNSTQLADLTQTFTDHKLRQETAHWFQPENPKDLRNTPYRLTERACVFLWLSGLLRHVSREEHWNALKGNEKLKNFLRTTVEDHREHADGTGPAGKSGREISLFGRILSVAEAFDRPIANILDRAPMHVDGALEEVQEQKNQGRLDPEIVGEFNRVMSDDQGKAFLAGLEQRDRTGETERIRKPAFFSEQTATKYPTARFIGAALRSLQGLSQEKRHEVYQIAKVAQVLARRLKLSETDKDSILEELRSQGLTKEAEHFVEPIGQSGRHRLTPFGTVLGLVVPSLLREAASRRQGAITEIEGKPEYGRFFQTVLDREKQMEGDGKTHSLFASMLRLFNHVGNWTLKRDFHLPTRKDDLLDEIEKGESEGRFHEGLAGQTGKIINDPAVFNQMVGVVDPHPYDVKVNRKELRGIRAARKAAKTARESRQ